MRLRASLLLFSFLVGCNPSQEGREKAIVGAILIDGAGGPPLSDSIVIVSGGRIAEVGRRLNVLIPAGSDKVNGAGKYLVPALVDVCDRPDPPGMVRAATVPEAEAQVAELAARRVALLHVDETAPTAAAAMDAARNAGIRVAGHISTQRGARAMVDNGASVLIGMIGDTTDLDSTLLARMRNLRIVVAPSLAQSAAQSGIAARNTLAMFRAGVLIGLASGGAGAIKEAGLLSAAGIPPLDVIVAASRNSAMALGQLDSRGTIEPGKRADLLLLSANPGEDIANLRQVVRRMEAGEWVP